MRFINFVFNHFHLAKVRRLPYLILIILLSFCGTRDNKNYVGHINDQESVTPDTLKQDFILEEDWIVAFNHDPDYFFGKIEKKKNRYLFRPYGQNA